MSKHFEQRADLNLMVREKGDFRSNETEKKYSPYVRTTITLLRYVYPYRKLNTRPIVRLGKREREKKNISKFPQSIRLDFYVVHGKFSHIPCDVTVREKCFNQFNVRKAIYDI